MVPTVSVEVKIYIEQETFNGRDASQYFQSLKGLGERFYKM